MKVKVKKYYNRFKEPRWKVGFKCFPMFRWHWFAQKFESERAAVHFTKCIMTDEEERRAGL